MPPVGGYTRPWANALLTKRNKQQQELLAHKEEIKIKSIELT